MNYEKLVRLALSGLSESDMTEKSFQAHRPNGFALKFPNGNWLSTIWGTASYSDNYDEIMKVEPREPLEPFLKPMASNSVEVMIDCDEKLKARIFRKFDTPHDANVIGHLNFNDWLYIVNALAK